MNVKKFMYLFVAILLCISLIAGCTTQKDKADEQNAGTGGATQDEGNKQEKPEEVTLRFMWWGGEARHQATLEAINTYQKNNPHVKINAEYGGVDGYLQKLATQLSSRTAPDIIQIDVTWILELTSQGDFFVNLNERDEIDTSIFDKNFLDQFCYHDGKLIGLPTGVNAGALLYNKDFFKKYGIDEKMKWTWDSLLEVAKAVHEKDPNAYLLNFDAIRSYYALKAYVIQKTGNYWINDDYTLGFDRETLVEAFNYLNKLFEAGAIEPFEQSAPFHGKPDQNPKWLNGEIGMSWSWTSTYAAEKANIPNLSIAMIPIMEGAKDTALVVRPSQLLAINKDSKNVAEAAKFLNWFFSDPEAAKILKDVRGVPATKAARDVLVENNMLDPVLNEATTMAMEKMGKPENAISQNQELEKITTDVIQMLAYKKLTPEQAADELIDRFTQKLSELKEQLNK